MAKAALDLLECTGEREGGRKGKRKKGKEEQREGGREEERKRVCVCLGEREREDLFPEEAPVLVPRQALSAFTPRSTWDASGFRVSDFAFRVSYRGTSLIPPPPPVGPYSSPMPRDLW